ncbi:unnamed protein product, partial [Ilex paraguariensis]
AQAHTVLEMNYTAQQLTAAVVSEGLRPILADLELGAPASLLPLIQRCWDGNPLKRPSFDDIMVALDSILETRNRVKDEEKVLPEPSLSPGDKDTANRRIFQESINWFSQGEYFSKRVSPAPGSGVRIGFDSSNDPLAYCPVLSWVPSLLVGGGNLWRTHTSLCRICAMKRISMRLESLMVIEVLNKMMYFQS